MFIADIKVGTPPQTLKVAIDTGSISWVQSTDTIYKEVTEGPWAPLYRPNASKTAHRVRGAEWEVEYSNSCALVISTKVKSMLIPCSS